jgi:hypothetical protein
VVCGLSSDYCVQGCNADAKRLTLRQHDVQLQALLEFTNRQNNPIRLREVHRRKQTQEKRIEEVSHRRVCHT